MERPAASAAELTRRVLDLPLHRMLGLHLTQQEPGVAVAGFAATLNTLGPMEALHVGVVHALMESVCLLAVIPLLQPGEYAVTHDFHASVMRPIPGGQAVELRAKVQRQGKNVIFVDGEAWAAEKLCYMARVTKSVLRPDGAPADHGA
jgi:uncharacterized protein (TIGR00369 family)